ncbi:MAG: LacI family transcriptional regulator [Hyphomicrobiales bacterium]|nr:LacI family transcriptional regulator [Hyphomicrobiales bacterium]MCP5000569.1 LacI family transcriptional regulator [Hyphomicrobiales bacterium]
MSSRTKIKDIARVAGVSTATVSRALSDSSLVTHATRDKVREAASKLNYRLNVRARNLRIQKSMAVLLVVRNMSNPFYLEIFKGVEAVARAAGYVLLMGNTEDDDDRDIEYFDMLRDGQADGMILMTGKLPADHEVLQTASGMAPIVVALEAVDDCKLAHIQIDNCTAAKQAVNHLVSLGHRRIAHICGPLPEILGRLRLEGYRTAMAEAGLDIPEGYDPVGDYSIHSGKECCRQLFDREDPPTALFVANDEMAFGAIGELRRRGLGVPQDVSVIGFDDLFISESYSPPLTTISQPRMEIGQTAMTMLLDIIGARLTDPKTIEMPTELILRESTGPVIQ